MKVHNILIIFVLSMLSLIGCSKNPLNKDTIIVKQYSNEVKAIDVYNVACRQMIEQSLIQRQQWYSNLCADDDMHMVYDCDTILPFLTITMEFSLDIVDTNYPNWYRCNLECFSNQILHDQNFIYLQGYCKLRDNFGSGEDSRFIYMGTVSIKDTVIYNVCYFPQD